MSLCLSGTRYGARWTVAGVDSSTSATDVTHPAEPVLDLTTKPIVAMPLGNQSKAVGSEEEQLPNPASVVREASHRLVEQVRDMINFYRDSVPAATAGRTRAMAEIEDATREFGETMAQTLEHGDGVL